MGTNPELGLTFACWDYDRTNALQDGRVRPQGIDLRYLFIAPPESFFRMLHFGDFELSEMSLSWYTRTVFYEKRPFQAIPVFPSRMFRHSAIYVHKGSGIQAPSDLRGKRVGCPEYQMTAAVWVKGILADVYAVPVDSVEYVTGGLNEAGRREVPMNLPANIVVTPAGDEATLSGMLERGEIDALYGPEPECFRRSSNVARLFEDYPAEERAYFQKTRIFPIMHTVVIRQDVLDAHPWVAVSMVKAFEAAKKIAFENLFEIGAVKTMLPWLVSDADATHDFFDGEDWWPYGIDANRATLDTFLRYSYEQGLSPRRLQAEELFVPSTLRQSRT
jgi:4,5-dihydroxyphthalate decarboxylase